MARSGTRCQVERDYLQLKDELGLDHFEGRSWNGFYHHAALTFLALECQRAAAADPTAPPGGARHGA